MRVLNNNEINTVFGGFGGDEHHSELQKDAEELFEDNEPAPEGHEWHCYKVPNHDGDRFRESVTCRVRPKQQNFFG